MHSSGFFRIKPIARLICKSEILGSHTISDQSLLLSTIVLNDMGFNYTVKPVMHAIMYVLWCRFYCLSIYVGYKWPNRITDVPRAVSCMTDQTDDIAIASGKFCSCSTIAYSNPV